MEAKQKQYKDLKPAITITFVLLLIMIILAIWTSFQLPSDIKLPVHWGMNGQPDRYAGKFQALFMMPLVIFLLSLLMIVVPVIEPRQRHINMSMKAYNLILISIVLVFFSLHCVMILNALGTPMDISTIVPIFIGILFIFMGNFMGKVRSNFMLGIKTPWTLSSELSWNKTHRLGGRLFILTGFLIVLFRLITTGTITMIILLVGVFGTVIGTFTYSYIIWKNDPDKKNIENQ